MAASAEASALEGAGLLTVYALGLGVPFVLSALALDRIGALGRAVLRAHRSVEIVGGAVLALNFWASWCIPCKQENPELASVWERYRKTEVVLIGIVYQDSPDAAREYTERLGNTWPSGIDADGRTAIAYGVFGIPETYFIGPDGVIAGRHIGAIDQATLMAGIEAIRQRTPVP